MGVKASEYMDGMHIIDDGRVRAFLISGEDEGILIDAGFEDSEFAEVIAGLTDKPLRIILTHGDPDHIGGLKRGVHGNCSINPDDKHILARIGVEVEPNEIEVGQHVNVGDYNFKILHVPGHTYGSIMLFDEDKGLLISGDPIQRNNPIFMFGEDRNLPLYIESIKSLLPLAGKIQTIIPSHGPYPLTADAITECIEAAEELQAGHLEGKPHAFLPCKHYVYKNVEFYK